MLRNESIWDLVKNVITWAEARNLIAGSNPAAQFLKIMEEHGEYLEAIDGHRQAVEASRLSKSFERVAQGRAAEALDGIGDTFVVAIIIAAQENVIGMLPVFRGEGRLTATRALSALAVALQDRTTNRDIQVATAIWELSDALEGNARELGSTLEKCLRVAWEEIKDRKGSMVGGIFVKEENDA